MKKSIFTLALALSLVMGCMAVPAFAAGGQSEELTKVTLAVKGQLGLGDEYDKFSGDCTDLGVLRYWQLSWSKEDGSSLNVTADSNGKILSYSCYVPDTGDAPVSSWDGNGFNPSFPAVNAAQAEAAAQTFLSKVVSAPESVELEPVTLRLSGYRRWVSVSGNILLNGVSSPMSFSLRLSLPDLTVVSYDRRDAWGSVVLGDVPAATPAVTAGAAKTSLNSVLKMELRYVDGDDGAVALRYVPTTQGNWYVDAQTGEPVDLSKLPGGDRLFLGETGGAYKNDAMDAEAPEAAPSLSPVEQATVDQLAGTLSADELDALLKKIAPLGLDKMTQAGASYYMSGSTVTPLSGKPAGDDAGIVCRLVYTRDLTEAETDPKSADDPDAKPVLRKYITVDAVTGALLRVSTSSEYAKEDAWQGDAAAAAKDFLSAQYPDYFAASVRKNEDTAYYVRQVNGIPCYSNYLNASVCGVDGTIGYFSMEWDEDAQFPAPEGIVDAKAAMDAYAGCFETKLSYTAYPEKVDTNDPQWLTYSQHLGDVKYRWVLSYVLSGDTPQGVDAFTGKVLTWSGKTDTPLVYTDLAGCYGREEIESLAAYGVGFSRGDKFRPTQKVTQRDMLVLLLSAVGCTYDADNMDQETEDSLYNTAYAQGLLTKAQRDPGKTVTRLDFLKTMLAASAYGKAAQLQGIYHTGFTDAGTIPTADLGYAAIGQALGIVSGNQNKALGPNDPITRQDAAIMLCRFMGR